jgi:PKD domain-containing protein
MQLHLRQLAAALVLFCLINASASVLYVDLNSTNPTPPYTNWATAATNIQDAVDAAVAGDLVLVTNGVYQTGGRLASGGMTNRVVADKPVTVQSVNGQTVTLIDGGQLLRCVYLANGAAISGFTLTNGTAGGENGGGAYCTSTNEQILNCLLIKNSAWDGAGVYSGTLTNCSLSGNNATDSGGGAASSALFNCALSGNSAGFSGWGGGGYYATLNNCTLSGNSAGWNGGGAAFCTLNSSAIINNTARYVGGGAANCTLNNCTITGNRFNDSSGYGGGVGWSFGAGATAVNNCILFFNVDLYGSPNNYSGGGTLNYCCTTPLAGGTGNFTDDPQFVNYAGGNLRLATSSLCINTGGNAYLTNSTDLDGNPRLVGGVVDVGAYECQSVLPVPVAPSLQATYSQVITGFVVGFTGQIGGRPTASRWEFGDGTIISNQLPNVSHAWAAPGNHVVALRAYNDSYPAGATATVIIQVSGASAWYVRQTNAHPASPYTSWATAATNIQTAVDAAYAGGTVWVSNGVYQAGGRVVYGSMSNRVAVTGPVTVRSVNGPGVTVIQGYRAPGTPSGNSNVRCVYLANGAALVGFTLTNGATRGLGDILREQSGGGVWCESTSVVVSNCVLVGNWATNYGGGIYSGTLFNCKLAGNSAYYGGGGYNATLNNCIVTSNTASGPGMPGYGSYGGGIYSGKLCNCTLVGNSATNGGGVYSSTLTNCTLANNTASAGGGGYSSTFRNCVLYYNAASSGSNYTAGTLSYCCASPLSAGMGNFPNAPLFVDLPGGNLRLKSNSPCINAGNNLYICGTADLDGRPRLVGGTVDIGAFESQGPGLGEFIGWLQQYALPTDGTADSIDTDHDGMNNWQEWICGTNPTNSLSVLKMLSPSNSMSGLTLNWQSVSGKTYFLQRSTDLELAFSSIQSNIVGQAGTTSFTDANATGYGPYFYRVGVHQ